MKPSLFASLVFASAADSNCSPPRRDMLQGSPRTLQRGCPRTPSSILWNRFPWYQIAGAAFDRRFLDLDRRTLDRQRASDTLPDSFVDTCRRESLSLSSTSTSLAREVASAELVGITPELRVPALSSMHLERFERLLVEWVHELCRVLDRPLRVGC